MKKGRTFVFDEYKSEEPDLTKWDMIIIFPYEEHLWSLRKEQVEKINKMIDWCEENNTSEFWIGTACLWFEKEEDSVLFKLYWIDDLPNIPSVLS